MATIHIYSVAYNRPDFIALQYESVVKHIQQHVNFGWDVKFRVMINTRDPLMKEQLEQECKRLQIQYLVVPIKEGELYNGGLTAYNYMRDHFFPETANTDYSVIMDSDMFFYNRMKIEELLEGNDVAAIYHQRQKKILGFTKYNYEYLWVGFMVFSHQRFDWEGIRFDPVKNICDVGGMTSFYLKDNVKKGLKVKWLKHTPDITHEFQNIFPSVLWEYYLPEMGFQIIEDAIIHYYRGSNWNSSSKKFIKAKDNFVTQFLSEYEGERIFESTLEYYDSLAYSRKHFNGIVNNENKHINPRLGNVSKL